MAEYIQRGETVEYANGNVSDIDRGDIVAIGGCIGIADDDIVEKALRVKTSSR